MLPAKQLWQWHKARESLRAAQEELAKWEEKRIRIDQRVSGLAAQLEALPTPASSDQELARLLLEQELWLAKKEQQELHEYTGNQSFALQQTMQELQYQVLTLEQELDEEYLAAYLRLAEMKTQPIAEVRNKACMGCGRPLSLRNLDEWRRAKGPVFCNECDRLLV